MTPRVVLDLRTGAPWTAVDDQVFRATAAAAWADPRHPSSEGRRAATWLEAAEATVQAITGAEHVSFHADRDAALQAVLAARPGIPRFAAATHRRLVLRHTDHVVPVDTSGLAAWPSEAGLFLAQAANEETGVADPLPAEGDVILDASTCFGRLLDLPAAEHTILDAAAWGSPVPVGLVLGRAALPAQPVPPLPLVAVAVQALALHWPQRQERARRDALAMAAFEHRVRQDIPDVDFHGTPAAPHIRSLSVLHLDAETLMRALDAEGYVVGSGSACVADGTPSHVLAAMGGLTHGNLRVALPVATAPEELENFAEVLARTVRRLREEAGVADL